MGRFVVFDQETIDKLPQDLGAVAELSFGLYPRDTLEYFDPIFEKNTESLVIIPAKTPGYVCMVHLQPLPKPEVQATDDEPEYEASGFLGLNDSVYEPEPKRRWWHWFWS